MISFLSDLIDSKIAVRCKTKETANRFLKLCLDNGIKLISHAPINITKTFWDEQENSVCYVLSKCFHYDLNSYVGLTSVPYECLKEDKFQCIDF